MDPDDLANRLTVELAVVFYFRPTTMQLRRSMPHGWDPQPVHAMTGAGTV
jgi:hypothetical protein